MKIKIQQIPFPAFSEFWPLTKGHEWHYQVGDFRWGIVGSATGIVLSVSDGCYGYPHSLNLDYDPYISDVENERQMSIAYADSLRTLQAYFRKKVIQRFGLYIEGTVQYI